MIREVDLLSYLPPFMQEYEETKKIAQTENPEFQKIWELIEDARNQLYYVTATEQGLSRFEKMLKIYPTSEDTIESRRARIATIWNDIPPYTYPALLLMLQGDFEVIPDFKNYLITIKTKINNYGGFRDLAYIIENVIPLNLVVNSVNTVDMNTTQQLYWGTTVASVTTYSI